MSMFDNSIPQEKLKSLELAEDSREKEWKYPSYALKLFYGEVDFKLIYPLPEQSAEEKKLGDDYLAKMEKFLRENLDPNEVDRTGIIPDKVYKGLAEIGAFALKIPKEYGGMGFSQYNYNRIMHLISSYCGSTAVLLSAHQSIGAPQPLKLFGTPEQKKKYLPMFAQGAISAFALTEPTVGSDPRQMLTTATPAEDGRFFLLNGEKLWCTNGPIADVIVVMAVTPPKTIHGKEVKQITAFIVETQWPGVEKVHRCEFMGLHGMQNGLIRFNNVKVPRENVILSEGEGLKLAFMTLNTGRLTLPAASAAVSKLCLYISRSWSQKRHQWGSAISEHETIALKLCFMAAHTFAIDAITWLTSAMADDKHRDIRLEAAMAKYFTTEFSWKIADETLQIRGGSGYETSQSLNQRGQEDWPVERIVRDIRINRIIEGTSEVMRLFIAREALDAHLSRLKPLMSSRSSMMDKIKAVFSITGYYTLWYSGLWMPRFFLSHTAKLPAVLRCHMTYVGQASRRVAREVFHQMLRYQKRLESKQALLNRVVDIATELFVMSAVCSYADMLIKKGQVNAIELADGFCKASRGRIDAFFHEGKHNHDKANLSLARGVASGAFQWMEEGIIK